ncbi:MAG TPA: membrane protein insertion efficiency factor YidD [Thermoanaerobaculia bacterium]
MRFWLAALVALLLVVVTAHDLAHETRYSWSARTAIAGIDSYRAHVSPHLRGYVQCRFTPTCSAYGREVVRKYGFAKGGWMAVKRIARCGPWTKFGTIDPP